MAKDVDSLAGLQQLFQELQVPECFVEALQASGVACLADFAYAYATAADLSVFAEARSDEFWQALQVQDPEHSMHMARMRRAYPRPGLGQGSGRAACVRAARPSSALSRAQPASRARKCLGRARTAQARRKHSHAPAGKLS